MAFGILRKSAKRNLGNSKPNQNRAARSQTYFRPAVEQLEDRRLPSAIVPISLANGGPSVTPNGDSNTMTPTVSADGRFIAFRSQAANIVPGQTDTNGAWDVFLYDRLTGTTVLVSHSSESTTTTANGDSGDLFVRSMSSDGRFITFESTATNLVAGQVDTNNAFDTFLYDRLTGANILVSHTNNSQTTASNGESSGRMSADGNFVALESQSTDLIAGETSAGTFDQVFLWDRQTGSLILISHSFSSATAAANDQSDSPNINADGSAIAFNSKATDLINGFVGPANQRNIFLFNRLTGNLVLVSHLPGSSTMAADGLFFHGSGGISADGRFVVYASASDSLDPGVTGDNNAIDAYLYDSSTGSNTLISHSYLGNKILSNKGEFSPIISPDGSTIAFASPSTDLVNGQQENNNTDDVFVYDRFSGQIALVSHAAGSFSSTGNGESGVGEGGYFSFDGSDLLYVSTATNLVTGQNDPNGKSDVFLYQKATGLNTLISHVPGSETTTGNADSGSTNGGAISNDGRFVAFSSDSSDLVVGDLNNHSDVFGVVKGPLSDLIGRVSQSGQIWTGVSTGVSFFSSLWTTWSTGTTWVDVLSGDFTGDGLTDIAARDANTGNWWVGVSTGSSFTMSVWETWSTDVTWADVQVGDFNGDGKADIVGRYAEGGDWWVALSTGSGFTASKWNTWSTGATWVDVKVGDFNGDGKADITGRYLEGGSWWTGLSTGSSFATTKWATWSTSVKWVDVQVGDFNGDGKEDITGRAFQTGDWWTNLSTGSSFTMSKWATWSTSVNWVDVKVGDFNGDGILDIVGRALQTGDWWAGISNGSIFTSSKWDTWSTGVTWVDVQVGDFNGDGKADITGRALQTGDWWTALSTGSAFTTTKWATWSTGVTWTAVRTGDFA